LKQTRGDGLGYEKIYSGKRVREQRHKLDPDSNKELAKFDREVAAVAV
jgi:hypothetical protein